MNLRQNNYLNMYRSVEVVLTNHQTVYDANAGFKELVIELRNKIKTITDVGTLQNQVTTGVKMDKDVMKETLARMAATIAGAIKSYATKASMLQVKEEVDYTDKMLMRSRDELLISRCEGIKQRANEFKDQIALYGINPELLTAFATLVTDFSKRKSSTRVARTEKTVATFSLAELMDQTKRLLKDQIDASILIFSQSQPDFYNQYKNARKVIDIGSRTIPVPEPTPQV